MCVPGNLPPVTFTLGYVPGVTPAKWVRTWQEREPGVPLTLTQVPAADAAALARDGGADAVLLRLPADRTGLHAIPLYTETTVLVVPRDHVLTAADELSPADVADEVLLHPEDDTLDWAGPPGRPALHRPATTKDAVELVAAGVGLLVVPQSLARLHHRRDLAYRPLTGTPQSSVALSWPDTGETTDLVELFIGIVRGRTANSTRGRPPTPPKPKPERKARPAADNRRQQGARGRKPRRRS